MALHRDIYWVGRQWAVTGFGLQAMDQRLKGAFDIEASRLWDSHISDRICEHAWVIAEDFERALSIARARFVEPQRKPLPLVESVLELIQPAHVPMPEPAAAWTESSQQTGEEVAEAQPDHPDEAPTTQDAAPAAQYEGRLDAIEHEVQDLLRSAKAHAPPPMPTLRTEAHARFLPQWRIRR